jgi:hypothetical protein
VAHGCAGANVDSVSRRLIAALGSIAASVAGCGVSASLDASTGPPSGREQLAVRDAAVGIVGPAPGPVSVFCSWELGADSSVYICEAVAVLPPGRTPTVTDGLWFSQQWQRFKAPDANATSTLGTFEGREIALDLVSVARDNGDGTLSQLSWQCDHQAYLAALGHPFPLAVDEVQTGACRIAPSGDGYSVADAIH